MSGLQMILLVLGLGAFYIAARLVVQFFAEQHVERTEFQQPPAPSEIGAQVDEVANGPATDDEHRLGARLGRDAAVLNPAPDDEDKDRTEATS